MQHCLKSISTRTHSPDNRHVTAYWDGYFNAGTSPQRRIINFKLFTQSTDLNPDHRIFTDTISGRIPIKNLYADSIFTGVAHSPGDCLLDKKTQQTTHAWRINKHTACQNRLKSGPNLTRRNGIDIILPVFHCGHDAHYRPITFMKCRPNRAFIRLNTMLIISVFNNYLKFWIHLSRPLNLTCCFKK